MIHIKAFTFSPISENTYVLYNNEGKAIIIDPGCYFPNEQETLKNFLTDNSLTPLYLLNTHCHLDHVFGNKWVHETYGLEPHLHPNEEAMLALAPVSGERWGLPFENYAGPLHFLNDGDTVLLGDTEIQVILAPGHSPGSICFYIPSQGDLMGGDVLFRGSIGRTDLPGGDSETLLHSIREKLWVLPDETVVYS